ncbi:hypothetical protein BK670_08625 [Pseudomonas fluorescens]|uniref:Solute-binding protein family 3/N-terminal domain-containing protein n=1 Tax=Pseudomonas fluorescens TaxID=294 RepID=A0A423MH78_PSEFL|nr:hypothetical protein BK670_08625 [Pseudomonas fluorescens]
MTLQVGLIAIGTSLLVALLNATILVFFSWAKQNPGYRVLDEKLGAEAPIAPAVKKGNIELRDWVNTELTKLGEEKYLLKLYDQYVRKELSDDTQPESVIVEGGKWQG